MMLMFKKLLLLFMIIHFLLSGEAFSQTTHFSSGAYEVTIPEIPGIRTQMLDNIAPIVEKSIAAGDYPGAVILVGHRGHVIYRGVFGYRRLLPDKAPMQFDTVFDLASLTKVVAVTPAIMQLLEQGKLTLDAPVAAYWPAFGVHGKDKITIRELLTHESGLPADISLPQPSKNQDHQQNSKGLVKQSNSKSFIDQQNSKSFIDPKNSKDLSQQNSKSLIYQQIEQLHPSLKKKFVYSDINFIVLAHLVEIISNESFDHYVQDHLFNPLRMNNTFFNPAAALRDRIAPTEISQGQLRWGKTQDPLAYAMGGVSGNAGLFSDAHDLGLYAECLLNGGRIPQTKKERAEDHYRVGQTHAGSTEDHYLLGPLSILKMTTPQTPPQDANVRGLGWDIDSPYSNRGVLLPITSFGHTGWTGTSIWIDPTTQTYIIILTSRLHPKPAHVNQLIEDRRLIANFVAASLTDVKNVSESNTGFGELTRAYVNNHA
jgi:serine-type D-Ala-D-Ala carboxypeptidase